MVGCFGVQIEDRELVPTWLLASLLLRTLFRLAMPKNLHVDMWPVILQVVWLCGKLQPTPALLVICPRACVLIPSPVDCGWVPCVFASVVVHAVAAAGRRASRTRCHADR